MINNRQGGRRRGRGGQRGPNVSGGQPGNRQDNRQRGNAAQLLEKYKSMARDAQLAGDRVQTEYYLQYADHYFRMLGESQSRFNEQRRQRGDDMDDDEGDEDQVDAGDSDNNEDDDRPQRGERPERNERTERPERPERAERSERPERAERPERPARGERFERRPPRERAQRSSANDERGNDDRDAPERGNGDGETIPFDVLPPAIGLDDSQGNDEAPEAEARPARRRTRAPRRPDGDSDVAPAA